LWDLATGKQIRTYHGASKGRKAMALSADGKVVACADKKGLIRLWDVADGRLLATLSQTGGGQLTALAFTADGKRLAALGSQEGTSQEARLLVVATGKILRRFDTGCPADGVALAPDGRTAASLNDRGAPRLWDVATGASRDLMHDQPAACGRLSFSPDGKTLLEAETDKKRLHLWDVATARERQLELSGLSNEKSNIVLSPDRLTVAGSDNTFVLRLWDAATGKPLLAFPGHAAAPGHLAFSPDGKALTSWADDGVFRWDVANGRPTCPTPRLGSVVRERTGNSRWAVCFDWLALADRGKVSLYDCRLGTSVGEWSVDTKDKDLVDLAFSPRGDRLALAASDGKVWVWQIPAGRLTQVLDTAEKGGPAEWVLFHPDGRTLATGSGTGDRAPGCTAPCVLLWEIATGKHLGQVAASPESCGDVVLLSEEWQCSFSPDGQTLFACNSGSLFVWDLAERRDVTYRYAPEEDEGVTLYWRVAVSPDGRLLARVSGHSILDVCEAASGKRLVRLTDRCPSISYLATGGGAVAAFSPDSRTLATGCQEDGSILLWNLPELFRIAHEDAISDKSVDGSRLWEALAADDIAEVYRAIGLLAADEKTALAVMAKHLRPIAPPAPKRLATLLHDLDSDVFRTREHATRELEQMGQAAHPFLERVRKGPASLEVRRRAERVLAELPPGSAERLREVRAVQVLEYLGTPAAQALLGRLATGMAEARLTQDAKMSLERLRHRAARKL
jgi:WD40 repeat protein